MQKISFMFENQLYEFEEGLFFGLPENVYHRIPALSSTGIKNLLVSPMDFWANCPWMNPFFEEDAEDDDAKEWRVFGKASHVRILEGKAIFDSLYCVEFIPPEGCLETVAHLKKAFTDMGGQTKGTSGWTKENWITAVKELNPNAMILDEEKIKYFKETGGRTQLSPKDIRRIEIAAAMIEKHPELRYCFVGGYAEVTVLWCKDGIWFKSRLDYLKPQSYIDLKTFTNMGCKAIDFEPYSALYNVMNGHRYRVQACLYAEAADRAVEFAQKGTVTSYNQQRFGPTQDFLNQLGGNKEPLEPFYVFQKKGGAPIARGKQFPRSLHQFEKARYEIDKAVEIWKKNTETFGSDMWVDMTPITLFDDDLFALYAG